MSSIAETIAKLEKEAADKLTHANRLTQLKKQFPDLHEVVGRWDKVVYASKAANARVDAFEWRRNCGCCPDAPIEAWFFVVTEFGRVYSDPAYIFVGEQNPRTYRAEPYGDWEAKLTREGIPEHMIEQARVGIFGSSDKDRDDDEL